MGKPAASFHVRICCYSPTLSCELYYYANVIKPSSIGFVYVAARKGLGVGFGFDLREEWDLKAIDAVLKLFSSNNDNE